MYGQIHYQQKLGNSNLTLAEAGCFVTADANILEKIGIEVAPDALNKFYLDHGVFLYDLTDHANDDLSWWSVTKYHPQLTVKQVGGAGFPDSDLAQVEFRYQSHSHPGTTITHFCTVHSAADRSIIDSWDGLVKTPAQYEPIYGKPIAWATFVNNVPATVPSTLPPAAPLSAPAAQAPTPSNPTPANPRQIHLPAWVWIWHVYKPEGPYTLPYAVAALDPKMYGGLTYDILGSPAPNIYFIQTQMFGKVAIYAGPDTPATFTDGGHGEGESLPVTEVVPAPAPETPAEAEPVATPSVKYTRFLNEQGEPEPMEMLTKEGAKRVNFVSGAVVTTLEAGQPFTAVGKATLPNNDTYFMSENDFGIADETQRTPITVGIKTVDLSLAPEPKPEPTITITESPETIHVSVPAETPAEQATTDMPPAPIDSVHSWKKTFKFLPDVNQEDPKGMPYIAKEAMTVYDLETGASIPVAERQPVPVVGWFYFAGHKYYLAESSYNKHTWYGFLVTSLRRQKASDVPFDTHDDINQIEEEAITLSKTKHATIKAGATAQGFLSRFHKK